jgi:hypothetical protein
LICRVCRQSVADFPLHLGSSYPPCLDLLILAEPLRKSDWAITGTGEWRSSYCPMFARWWHVDKGQKGEFRECQQYTGLKRIDWHD